MNVCFNKTTHYTMLLCGFKWRLRELGPFYFNQSAWMVNDITASHSITSINTRNITISSLHKHNSGLIHFHPKPLQSVPSTSIHMKHTSSVLQSLPAEFMYIHRIIFFFFWLLVYSENCKLCTNMRADFVQT